MTIERGLSLWDTPSLEILWDKSDAAGDEDGCSYINLEICRRRGSMVTLTLPYAISSKALNDALYRLNH